MVIGGNLFGCLSNFLITVSKLVHLSSYEKAMLFNTINTLLDAIFAVDLQHVHMTHPPLGDEEPFGAVTGEAELPLSITPSVQASPPQRYGCQTLAAHV